MSDNQAAQEPADTEHRYRRLNVFWKWLLIIASVTAIFMSAYQVFNIGRFTGFVPIENQYYYAVVAVLLPMAFIAFPASGRHGVNGMSWYDLILFLATAGVTGTLVFYAIDIVDEGWEFSAPEFMQYLSLAFVLLAIEASRRTGGAIVTAIIVIFAIYPLFAGSMPGVLEGTSETLWDTVAYYSLSTEALIGIPTRAFAGLVIGFLLFGVALQYTGGGQFFLNLAFALLGHVRGGPAKVAIFASGLMGSMSGSVITNVLTTGAMSIPAMKRIGFAPHVAGGVEACASTGGVLMPPIMGATAFILAINLEVPYRDVVIAAVIPSILYFFALFMQIDGYAARNNLEGLPKVELPSLKQTLKDGWYYVAVFVLLIYLLVFLQREAQAPFYATGLLILINQILPQHRWNWARFVDFLVAVGRLFAELAAILAGIGLIVGALSYSGKVGTLAFELLQLAGNSVFLLLLLGAGQLHHGHRGYRHGGLYHPGLDLGAGPDRQRLELDGRSFVHALLGDAVVYHAAGGLGRVRRVKLGQGDTHADRFRSHEIGHHHLFRAVFLCPRSGPDHAGRAAAHPLCLRLRDAGGGGPVPRAAGLHLRHRRHHPAGRLAMAGARAAVARRLRLRHARQ